MVIDWPFLLILGIAITACLVGTAMHEGWEREQDAQRVAGLGDE